MENLDLTGVIFRVSIVYLYALALVRLSGKQSISQLTAMDFVVTLIIGDLFDDVFWVEVPVLQGMVAFAVLIIYRPYPGYVYLVSQHTLLPAGHASGEPGHRGGPPGAEKSPA